MAGKLLSIVVPTKNRQEYLKSLITIFCGYTRNDVELVIEDNSDSDDIRKYVMQLNDERIVYCYDNQHLSVVENSDRAIEHSSGEYVCFMGDDDLLSERACEFVEFMKRNEIDSAIFQVAKYYWPGTEFKAHKFPNLIIRNYKEKIRYIDVSKELKKLLDTGATSLNMMPKVYHGIVLRARLNQIKEKTGTYFPGPSPDMANSVALALLVKKHVYCEIPFISSGTSPKSTAGLGSKHKHIGNLKDISFLPADVEDNWCIDIPKVWTGPTIYAQSAVSSLINMGRSELISNFNFNYNYAFFEIFCPDYVTLFDEFKKTSKKYNQVEMLIAKIKIFFIRVKEFIKNILLVKCKYGGRLYSSVDSSIEAEKIIDSVIADIDMKALFNR